MEVYMKKAKQSLEHHSQKDRALRRKPLKYRVEGGLQKIAEIYERMDQDTDAAQKCWNDPSAYLGDVIAEDNLKLSSGYKELADSLSTLDLREICKDYSFEQIQAMERMDEQSIKTLLSGVVAHDGNVEFVKQAGPLSSEFPKATAVVVVVMMITVTVTSTNGPSTEISETPSTPSLGKGVDHAKLVDYAQAVADQIGWYQQN